MVWYGVCLKFWPNHSLNLRSLNDAFWNGHIRSEKLVIYLLGGISGFACTIMYYHDPSYLYRSRTKYQVVQGALILFIPVTDGVPLASASILCTSILSTQPRWWRQTSPWAVSSDIQCHSPGFFMKLAVARVLPPLAFWCGAFAPRLRFCVSAVRCSRICEDDWGRGVGIQVQKIWSWNNRSTVDDDQRPVGSIY